MKKILTLAVASLLVIALAVPAFAAPKNKGTTYVAPSAITLSVLVGVTSPGSLGDLGAGFGIVGKPAAKGFNDGVVKHVGGLEITTTLGDLEIRDFWIDTNAETVSAYVPALDARADLFTLSGVYEGGSDCEVGATLLFNDFASAVIVGSDVISGAEAATACVDL
jgi:hypothetical protein